MNVDLLNSILQILFKRENTRKFFQFETLKFIANHPKIAEKAVCRSVFLTTWLHFECRINETALLQIVFLAILPIYLSFAFCK